MGRVTNGVKPQYLAQAGSRPRCSLSAPGARPPERAAGPRGPAAASRPWPALAPTDRPAPPDVRGRRPADGHDDAPGGGPRIGRWRRVVGRRVVGPIAIVARPETTLPQEQQQHGRAQRHHAEMQAADDQYLSHARATAAGPMIPATGSVPASESRRSGRASIVRAPRPRHRGPPAHKSERAGLPLVAGSASQVR